MKHIIFTTFLIVTSTVTAQIQNLPTLPALSFDECIVLTRDSIDGEFNNEILFTGSGAITFYKDSIVLTYANKWECGKYLIHVTHTEQRREDNKHVTLYSGNAEYYDWFCGVQYFENDDGTKDVLLDTEFKDGVSMKRRIYMNLKTK